MSATKKFLAAAALLAAGATGQSLFTATTPQEAREEIAAAHDVTTRHGELTVRVDAGGADVTALAPVDPGVAGQVLTVSDSGVPVWRDPSAGGWTALAVADLTLVDGTGTAALADGRVRLTQTADTTAWYGYVASAWQASPGPYAWLAIPAGTREVVALARVYTGSPALDYRTTALLLRNGSDVTAAPTAPTPGVGSGVKLVGHGVWGHGSALFGTWDVSYPSASSVGAVWSATPDATTRWIGVRWTPGRVAGVACDAAGTPTIDDVLVHPTYTVTPAWPAPTLLVLALQRLTGGTAGTSTVDLDFVGWRR